jgi:hypothetical protein
MRQTGLWRITRRHVDPTPRIEVLHLESDESGLSSPATTWHETSFPDLFHRFIQWDELPSTLANLPDSSLVAVVQDGLAPLSADWPWEALGLFELFDDLMLLGGRIIGPDGLVQSAGEVFGVSGVLGSPCRGWRAATPRRHGMLLCQRTVSAVDSRFFVARAGFLARALAQRIATRPYLLSAWLAAAARQEGLRIAYSPHILLQATTASLTSVQSDEECRLFLESHWPVLTDDPYYSRFCSLRAGHGWKLAEPQSRAAVLNATLSRLAGSHPDVASILAHGDGYVARSPFAQSHARLDVGARIH